MVPDSVILAKPVLLSDAIGGLHEIVDVTVRWGKAQKTVSYDVPSMTPTVLSQIASLVADAMVAGVSLTGITISMKEYGVLAQELGTKGTIAMVNGVTITVGPVSDLPQIQVNMAPEAPTVMELLKQKMDQGIAAHEAAAADWVNFLDPPVMAHAGHEGPFGFGFSGFKPATALLFPSPQKIAPTPKVYHSSKSDEHGTPQPLFDVLDAEFHFDLDVCATEAHEVPVLDALYTGESTVLDPGNAKCPIYFTQETDGLAQDWFGTVWMNPPYTKGQVGKWIQKLVHELIAGRITRAVALVAARPDTLWFQVVASYACEIRFLKGRLTFQGSTDAAPFPSAVLVFDRSKTSQVVKFWDWKSGKAPSYVFGSGLKGQAHVAIQKLLKDPKMQQAMTEVPGAHTQLKKYAPGASFLLD